MKKFLSTILAVVMVLSSMAMVVSANEADLADGIYVGTTKYDTFTAAQSAAAANTNKEIIISGTVEFGSRQGISMDDLHLRGINNAKIIPSATYGNSTSDTNKKGLLNISGERVVVSDITFDGSVYGDTLAAPSTFDFKVLRITSGSTTLNNVRIEGSKRALLMVGTSTSTATVDAYNLTIVGESKTLDKSIAYADVELTSGSTLSIYSGSVENACVVGAAEKLTVEADGLYDFAYNGNTIYTTAEYIANTYVGNVNNISNSVAANYAGILTQNHETTSEIVADIKLANDYSLATAYIQMIDDVLSRKYTLFGIDMGYVVSNTDDRAFLTSCKTDLQSVAE